MRVGKSLAGIRHQNPPPSASDSSAWCQQVISLLPLPDSGCFPLAYITAKVYFKFFMKIIFAGIGNPAHHKDKLVLWLSYLCISLVMIEGTYILCLIITIISEVWTIIHCLGLGHETVVCAVFSIFLWGFMCLWAYLFEMAACLFWKETYA